MTGETLTYLLHGLPVTSPLILAAGRAVLGDAQDSVIELVLRDGAPARPAGDVLVRGPDEAAPLHTLSSDRAGWVLHLHGAASLHGRHGSDIVEVAVVDGGRRDLLPVLCSGPGLVATALMRGHSLLHASASWLPELGGVAAFVGPAGSGKSSMARLLSRAGGRLFSDDALRVDLDDSRPPRVHRGTTASRLRARVEELIDTSTHGDLAAATTLDGRSVIADNDNDNTPAQAELRAVVLPRLSPEAVRVEVRSVPTAAALVQLAASTPLAGLRDPTLLRRQFDLASGILAGVPVAELWVPWPTRILGEGLAIEVLGELQALVGAAPTVTGVGCDL